MDCIAATEPSRRPRRAGHRLALALAASTALASLAAAAQPPPHVFVQREGREARPARPLRGP